MLRTGPARFAPGTIKTATTAMRTLHIRANPLLRPVNRPDAVQNLPSHMSRRSESGSSSQQFLYVQHDQHTAIAKQRGAGDPRRTGQ